MFYILKNNFYNITLLLQGFTIPLSFEFHAYFSEIQYALMYNEKTASKTKLIKK